MAASIPDVERELCMRIAPINAEYAPRLAQRLASLSQTQVANLLASEAALVEAVDWALAQELQLEQNLATSTKGPGKEMQLQQQQEQLLQQQLQMQQQQQLQLQMQQQQLQQQQLQQQQQASLGSYPYSQQELLEQSMNSPFPQANMAWQFSESDGNAGQVTTVGQVTTTVKQVSTPMPGSLAVDDGPAMRRGVQSSAMATTELTPPSKLPNLSDQDSTAILVNRVAQMHSEMALRIVEKIFDQGPAAVQECVSSDGALQQRVEMALAALFREEAGHAAAAAAPPAAASQQQAGPSTGYVMQQQMQQQQLQTQPQALQPQQLPPQQPQLPQQQPPPLSQQKLPSAAAPQAMAQQQPPLQAMQPMQPPVQSMQPLSPLASQLPPPPVSTQMQPSQPMVSSQPLVSSQPMVSSQPLVSSQPMVQPATLAPQFATPTRMLMEQSPAPVRSVQRGVSPLRAVSPVRAVSPMRATSPLPYGAAPPLSAASLSVSRVWGLEEFLGELSLTEYLPAASTWANSMGAVVLEEFIQKQEDFADALNLRPLERKRLQRNGEEVVARLIQWRPTPVKRSQYTSVAA